MDPCAACVHADTSTASGAPPEARLGAEEEQALQMEEDDEYDLRSLTRRRSGFASCQRLSAYCAVCLALAACAIFLATRPGPAPLSTEGLKAACKDSLVEYHLWLTRWFTGAVPASAVGEVVAALRFAEGGTLTLPSGMTIESGHLAAALQGYHATEPPGSTHRPDLASIVYHTASPKLVDLTFHELQLRPIENEGDGALWRLCTMRTRGVCEAAPAAAPTVTPRTPMAWSSFVEEFVGCERVAPND